MPVALLTTLAVLSLILGISSDRADPICDFTYGSPNYSDCLDLSYELYNGWPGTQGDQWDHFFALKKSPIPEWVSSEARYHYTHIPKIVQNSQPSVPIILFILT